LKAALIVSNTNNIRDATSPNYSNKSIISQRSFLNRTFGALGKGSLRGSMF